MFRALIVTEFYDFGETFVRGSQGHIMIYKHNSTLMH